MLIAGSGDDIARGETKSSRVSTLRVPDGGIQPQTVVDGGRLHMIYFSGDPKAGDGFYVESTDDGRSFSHPLRVNSQSGSVVAVGNIRGAHLAVGKNGRAHVAWNGSGNARPKAPDGTSPMLYARLNDQRTGFEPQRNLIQARAGLDGGGSIAADRDGNIYVTWHAFDSGVRDETNRRVWITRSSDDGRTFAPEWAAFDESTGACGCCGMRAFADSAGNVHLFYRGAGENVHRDMYLLTSANRGATFSGRNVDGWEINQCMMSSAALADGPAGLLAAWETEGQVFFTGMTESKADEPAIPATGNGRRRKHPVVVANQHGDVIMAWTEGMGWKRGGAVAWQVYDKTGSAIAGSSGRAEGVPVWSLIAVFARSDGGFTVVY